MTLYATIEQSVQRIEGCRLRTDDYYDLPYAALLASADPMNWPKIQPKRFIRMIPLGTNDQGWRRIIEHGLGNWGMKHRTPLKFWTELIGADGTGGYHVSYELDTECDSRRCDPTLYVDEGYILVTPDGPGVRVRTSKLFAIRGISPMLCSFVFPTLGWAKEGHEFFHNAATISDPVPFEVSRNPCRSSTRA